MLGFLGKCLVRLVVAMNLDPLTSVIQFLWFLEGPCIPTANKSSLVLAPLVKAEYPKSRSQLIGNAR